MSAMSGGVDFSGMLDVGGPQNFRIYSPEGVSEQLLVTSDAKFLSLN
jgi:hypothetical protein